LTARELYEKIKENYPDFKPEPAQEYNFNYDLRPFLTQKECELLEMGFKLDKKIPEDHVPLPKDHVDNIIDAVNSPSCDVKTKTQKAPF